MTTTIASASLGNIVMIMTTIYYQRQPHSAALHIRRRNIIILVSYYIIAIMNDVLGKPRQLSFPSNEGPPDRRYNSRTTDYITTAPPLVVLEVVEEGEEEKELLRSSIRGWKDGHNYCSI